MRSIRWVIRVKPTEWKSGVQCYLVVDSTYLQVSKATKLTIHDLRVIGSWVEGLQILVHTGYSVSSGKPQWRPLTSSLRSERMATSKTSADNVAVAVKTSKKTATSLKKTAPKKAAKKVVKKSTKTVVSGNGKPSKKEKKNDKPVKKSKGKSQFTDAQFGILKVLKIGEQDRNFLKGKVPHSNYSSLMRSLEEKSLIKEVPTDGRVKSYQITAAGKKTVSKV